MYRFKYLPWRSLLRVSGLTIVVIIFLEVLLSVGYTQLPAIHYILSVLYAPPLGIVTICAVAVSVGVLAVYLLERYYPQVPINTATLWALVACLALVLFLKSLLPLQGLLVNFTYPQFLAVALGVFWRGRPYWR